MISNAFKGAYTNEVGQQNQGINSITGGIKNLGAVAGLTALGATGGLGQVMSRLGGLGGQAVASILQEKTQSAQINEANKRKFTGEQVASTISAQLGDNPINRSAKKQLMTVFDALTNNSEIMNKKGNIESSLGDIDPNSELGKRILSSQETNKEPKYKKAIVYHGSFNKFDKFDTKYANSGNTNALNGPGWYFTDSKERAKLYGNNIYKAEIKYTTDYKEAKRTGKEKDYSYIKEKGDWIIPYNKTENIKILNMEEEQHDNDK